ncbi:MAG: BREX system Lon protease-like protein BrxL, partial [Candidatus Atribacteria bacterium]|nr:BREX system Lon protease-like protein BrxL [Candidatus Atribacteria bacterium]
MTSTLDQKIRDTFGDLAIDKRLVKRLGISGDDRHVPSYVMDWIITFLSGKAKGTTHLGESVAQFVKDHLPSKGEKEAVKFRLSQGEVVTILDAVSVEVRLGPETKYYATLPSLDEKKAVIDEDLIKTNLSLLLGSTWGAAKICLDEEEGGIRVIAFTPMQTGRVSLDAYKTCRQSFTVEEWLDVIIRTMGYEPDTYSEEEKIWMLCRMIPVVHNRVNMMELAPPGSGKSYLYNNISRYVWLTSGEITPAVLFYNRARGAPGVLTKYDLLVLDEAQSIRFSNPGEIQAQLKGYLEQGVFTRGDVEATAECGMMLLANIELQQDLSRSYKNGERAYLPHRADYIRRLPQVFLESPLVDRFHGIIPGWMIPPFSTKQQADGWGLKSDYFAEVCHALRAASDISQRIRPRLGLSGYKRDCTAIERLACGLAKLLLIEPDDARFEELVTRPAMELRHYVREQLHALDPQGYGPELVINRITIDLARGKERIGDYALIEKIAEGGMADVYRAYNVKTNAVVAIKKVRGAKNESEGKSIDREVQIYEKLKALAHPHIIKVYEVVSTGSEYCLVMEYADGGSLWGLVTEDDGQTVKVLGERDVIAIAIPIMDAVCAMHELEIVHRDIKPQNILRSDDQWRLADFGISKWIRTEVTGYTFQGAHSAPWAPPEQMEGAPAHRS